MLGLELDPAMKAGTYGGAGLLVAF